MDIKYSEDDIKLLVKKINWEGAGIENDPIVIPSSEGLPQNFAIVNSKLYISIRNCKFERVDLYRCWNVSVEHTSFNNLRFVYSFMNSFIKCEINKVGFQFSSGNRFKECTIPKISQAFGEKNRFQDCILTKRARKRINMNNFDTTDFKKILSIFFILLCFFPLLWIFNSAQLGLNLVLPILLVLIFIFFYLSLIRINKSKLNKRSESNKNKKKGV